MRLQGKITLITGAGAGLGRAFAEAFAREGAVVGVNDVNAAAADETVAAVRELGAQAEAFPADVSDSAAVAAMVTAAADTLGPIDVLVNNAGILHVPDGVIDRSDQVVQEMLAGGDVETQVLATQSLTDADWARMLAVHLNGTFYCTREVLKIMEARRSGKIVNIASIAGITGLVGVPHYCAAKGGIIAFTKSVAREVVRSGIQVNAIAPGFIDTAFLDPMSQIMKMATLAQIPLGRFGTVEEIAAAAVYLASDDSNFSVGQVVSPNGGQVI